MRADIEGAALVLGSATPSLEAEAMVRDGRARRLRITVRATGAALPTVRVIDMRNEKPVGKGGLFSTALYHRARKTLEEGRQVLLFLNRRGFSTQVLCKRCGWRARCTACDVNLTYYQGTSSLICHYCDARSEPPSKCPDCAAPDVRYNGAGTEKVAEAAMMLFPGKRVRRMDGETLRARGAAESIYADLKSGAIDILVGTQVIAKGLDIPRGGLDGRGVGLPRGRRHLRLRAAGEREDEERPKGESCGCGHRGSMPGAEVRGEVVRCRGRDLLAPCRHRGPARIFLS